VKTIGDALTSGSHSLGSLARLLDTPTQKLETKEHGGRLTGRYLDYAVDDAQVTWSASSSWRHVRTAWAAIPAAEPAAQRGDLGKACLTEMGIQPWRQLQPGFPARRLGEILSSYNGGRVAVRRRHEIVQVLYTDYKAMYATVCTLMASGTSSQPRVSTSATSAAKHGSWSRRSRLSSCAQSVLAWAGVLVQIEPDADLLPVRTDYTGEGQLAIGLNYLSDSRCWITLADLLVSVLRTGKQPRIRRATRFTPGPRQRGLHR